MTRRSSRRFAVRTDDTGTTTHVQQPSPVIPAGRNPNAEHDKPNSDITLFKDAGEDTSIGACRAWCLPAYEKLFRSPHPHIKFRLISLNNSFFSATLLRMTLPEKSEALKVLGENIRRIRQEKNISMQKLAHIADIELSQIYRIETGKVNPRFISLLVIARALEVSLSDLFKTTE